MKKQKSKILILITALLVIALVSGCTQTNYDEEIATAYSGSEIEETVSLFIEGSRIMGDIFVVDTACGGYIANQDYYYYMVILTCRTKDNAYFFYKYDIEQEEMIYIEDSMEKLTAIDVLEACDNKEDEESGYYFVLFE